MNQQTIEQYVTGRMSEAEAEAFEVACLEDPELARQVEFEQRLKAGLAQVARGSTAEFVRDGSSVNWMLAAAATIMLMIGTAAFLWQRLPSSHGQVLAAGAGGTNSTMRLALVRGAGNMPELPDGRVRVEIVGLFEPGQQYSIALDRLQSHGVLTVARLGGQSPITSNSLDVIVDSSQLEPGTYSLRVKNQSSGEEALDFSFVKP